MGFEPRLMSGGGGSRNAGGVWLLVGGVALVLLCIVPCIASVAAREVWRSVLEFFVAPRTTLKFLTVLSTVCAALLGLLFASAGLYVAAGQLAVATAILIPPLAGGFVYIGHYFTGNPVPLGPVYLLMVTYACVYPVMFFMFVESDFALRELLPAVVVSVLLFGPLSVAVTLGLAVPLGSFWVGIAARLAPLDPQVGGGVIIGLHVATAPLLMALVTGLCGFLPGRGYRFGLARFGGKDLAQLAVGGVCIALSAVIARYLLGTFGSHAVNGNWAAVHAQRSFLASVVVAPVLAGYTFWMAKRFHLTE